MLVNLFHPSLLTPSTTKNSQAALRSGQRASAHEPDEKKNTPLILAAASGSIPAVEKLINAEAHINGRNNAGDTALHVAAFRGYHDVCEVLIKGGADVNAQGELGNRPLHLAAAQHHVEATAVLLAHGAKVSIARKESWVLLAW